MEQETTMQKTWTTRCASNACVEVVANDGGETFTFTSNVDGNDGSVTYTAAEVSAFLADVKAGNFDSLHRQARDR
jgi:hypothetical protein